MLEIEKRIGCTLEEDYREHYTKKGWGQTRIAHRWRVPKVLIFFGNRRSNTPPWTERLGLEVRKQTVVPAVAPQKKGTGCEICGADNVIAQRAHWIANQDGGRKKDLTLSGSARITINCSMAEIRKRPNSRSRFSYSEKRSGSSKLAQT